MGILRSAFRKCNGIGYRQNLHWGRIDHCNAKITNSVIDLLPVEIEAGYCPMGYAGVAVKI